MLIKMKSITISFTDVLYVEKRKEISNGHERKRQRTTSGGASGFNFCYN